jgi:hypothetical protein
MADLSTLKPVQWKDVTVGQEVFLGTGSKEALGPYVVANKTAKTLHLPEGTTEFKAAGPLWVCQKAPVDDVLTLEDRKKALSLYIHTRLDMIEELRHISTVELKELAEDLASYAVKVLCS